MLPWRGALHTVLSSWCTVPSNVDRICQKLSRNNLSIFLFYYRKNGKVNWVFKMIILYFQNRDIMTNLRWHIQIKHFEVIKYCYPLVTCGNFHITESVSRTFLRFIWAIKTYLKRQSYFYTSILLYWMENCAYRICQQLKKLLGLWKWKFGKPISRGLSDYQVKWSK